MKKDEIINALKNDKQFLKDNYGVESIALFGSYAKGTNNDNSDIDVAVIVDEITGDFLEETRGLYKIRRKIDLSIEPVLLETKNDDSRFLEEILATGEVL